MEIPFKHSVIIQFIWHTESRTDNSFGGKLLKGILKSKVRDRHFTYLHLKIRVLSSKYYQYFQLCSHFNITINSKTWHTQWEGRHGKARTTTHTLSEFVGENALFIDQFRDSSKQSNISNGCYASLQSFLLQLLPTLLIRESL